LVKFGWKVTKFPKGRGYLTLLVKGALKERELGLLFPVGLKEGRNNPFGPFLKPLYKTLGP